MDNFNYQNTETINQKGGKTVRKVIIKKGKGHKTVTKYRKGKRVSTVKKPIHSQHILHIKMRKFIPGLFNDCNRTKKKRGGNNDLEMGPANINTEYMNSVPTDPDRFKKYEEQMRKESIRSISPQVSKSVFDGPNPESKLAMERNQMGNEDPLNVDPFQREDLQIFRG